MTIALKNIFSTNSTNINKNKAIFICFVFLSFLFRFWSFFYSVIDRDESLYLLVARSLLNGTPPYIEVWDNKPPGIFILFYWAISLLGDSVVSIRILACLSVAITSYFLYKLGGIFSENNKKIGLLSGILYLVFSLNNDGVAANTEIFFAPFVVITFYLLFKTNKYTYFTFLFLGLLLGIAMQLKYVVFMDFVAYLLIATHYSYFKIKNTNKFKIIILLNIFSSIGFILSFLAVALYFISVGYFEEYIYATVIANSKYIDATGFSLSNFLSAIIYQIYINFLLYLCLFLSPIYIKYPKNIILKDKIILCYFIVWVSLTFIATLLSKRFIDHYYLQLLPPLCLLSSYIIIKTLSNKLLTNKLRIILLSAITILLLQPVYPHLQKSTNVVINRYIKQQQNWGDKESIVANYIKAKIAPTDYIYVVNYQPIIYYLVEAKLPTKYVFPSHLVSYYSTITGINPLQELNSIMNKKPIYVVLDEQKEISDQYKIKLYSYLDKDYFLENSIENVMLYKLKF